MPDPYQVLNLPVDVEDEAVRVRYLELVRQFPPEQFPEQFAKIRDAYDQIRTLDARALYRLFKVGADDTMDAIIEDLTCSTTRPRPTLKQLIEMALRT